VERDRDRRMVQRKKSKIHKVMHCQTSVGRPATLSPRGTATSTFPGTSSCC
jgi:hypothetical protein